MREFNIDEIRGREVNKVMEFKNPQDRKIVSIESIPVFEIGCEIHPDREIRYVLAVIKDTNGNSKLIARADNLSSHNDIFETFTPDIFEQFRTHPKPMGGGFISFNESEKSIKIYGTSTGFGQADHKKMAEILASAYPGWRIEIGN